MMRVTFVCRHTRTVANHTGKSYEHLYCWVCNKYRFISKRDILTEETRQDPGEPLF